MTMPKYIKVTKEILYDVEICVSELKENGIAEPTFEEVIERIETLCEDDFSCGWGHVADLNELVFTDEGGNPL